ncbi:MAG TPA: YlbF family regulator [Candidatus Ventricola gallistercoris]|nr:YlbF family regulator [Candidatus Ventricola gallistercoris]
MSTVTECAKALGEAIVASEEYKNMQITEKAAMSDPAVAEAMGRYLELKNRIDSVMSQADADPEEISRYGREMDELQQQLNAMPAVDAMTTSRQKFSELMNQVNRVLEFIITGEVAQEGGCTGNCGSCGGCH